MFYNVKYQQRRLTMPEPAQRFLREEGLGKVMIQFLCWPGFDPDMGLSHTCSLLLFALEDCMYESCSCPSNPLTG